MKKEHMIDTNNKLFWTQLLDYRIDLLPCPHCKEPLRLLHMEMTNDNPMTMTTNCHNESCPNNGCWVLVRDYYREIMFVLHRINEGYHYPEHVKNFIKNIANDFNQKEQIPS